MALTESKHMAIGTEAPDFDLMDTRPGYPRVKFSDCQGYASYVVMFWCNHCPYVQHIQQAVLALANSLSPDEVAFFAISPNDVQAYPEDAPDKMGEMAERYGYPFPYLYDATQSVAKAYGAVCTPEFFVFDGFKRCAYHGRFDGATPGNDVAVTGTDLAEAIRRVCTGASPIDQQLPSLGCSIKWLPT